MRVIPQHDLQKLMTDLVTAAHRTKMADGSAAPLRTIDEQAMKTAALAAMVVLLGEAVTPE